MICEGRSSGNTWAIDSAHKRAVLASEMDPDERDALELVPPPYAPEIDRAWRGSA